MKIQNGHRMMNRPLIGAMLTLFSVTALLVPAGRAYSQSAPDVEGPLPDPAQMVRVEASINKGLEYLARVQNADGSWPSKFGSNNGINAYCLLAFLGAGHEPGRGPDRLVVDKAIRYILSTQDATGLFRSPNPSHGPMYEHGLATLAMIEASGFVPGPEMRLNVQNAINLIAKSQSPSGGWRYQPVPGDADISVTVMQVMALRAGQNGRYNVPQATIELANKYVRSCAVPSGGFGYQGPGGPGPARSAAGILSLQLLGQYDDPAVIKGLIYLKDAVPTYKPGIEHFYYMSYYAMQAHFQAGGNAWARWHTMQRDWLLENQQADGSWPAFGEPHGGTALTFSTPLATMCLEVYLHYLPAYQR